MAETKMALMTRLRAERRWDEADRFREETRERLKREGMRRGEAREEAWRLTAEKFPVVEKTKLQPPEQASQNIEAVRDGIIIDHTEDERRQLLELAQRPEAWTTNLTEAIERVIIQIGKQTTFSPRDAGSVAEWLLWQLWLGWDELFALLAHSEYLLRHGETLSSIAWPNATDRTVRLCHQFASDMKLLGRAADGDSCPAPHPVAASPVCG